MERIMIFSRLTLRKTVVAALLLAPAVVAAQGPTSTGTTPVGTTDPFWQISVNGGLYTPAWVLDRGGGTATSNWIGASASGSLPGGAADGDFQRFLYSWTTSFAGTSGMTATYRCARDDAFFSVFLNGAMVSGATCPDYSLSTSFSLSGFSDGLNSLEFRTGGNGVTDGFLLDIIDVTSATTVPEPTSIVLFASGLLGLAFAARARRKA